MRTCLLLCVDDVLHMRSSPSLSVFVYVASGQRKAAMVWKSRPIDAKKRQTLKLNKNGTLPLSHPGDSQCTRGAYCEIWTTHCEPRLCAYMEVERKKRVEEENHPIVW